MSDTLEDQDLDAQQDMQAESGGGYGGPPLPTPPMPPGEGAGSPIRTPYTPPPTAAQRWARASAAGEASESLGFTSQAFIPPADTARDKGALHDFKDQALATTVGMTADVVGAVRAASQAITQSPDAEAWLSAGVTKLQDFAESYIKDMSPKAQLAAKVKLFGPAGLDDEGKPVPAAGQLGWKPVILNRLAQIVPSLFLAAVPGGIQGRIVAGLAFGAMDAGGAYNQAADAFIKMTPAERQAVPFYAKLTEQGQSDQQASQATLTAMAASTHTMAHGLAGFAAGVGLSGAGGLLRGGTKTAAEKLAKGAAEPVGHGLLARTGIGTGEGGLILGGQAGVGEAANQANPVQPGGAQPFDYEKIALASLEPAITGAVLGGAAHAAFGKRPTPPTPAVEGVDPAHTTAMAEALLQLPAPLRGPATGGPEPIPMPGEAGLPPPPAGAAPASAGAPSWRDIQIDQQGGRPGTIPSQTEPTTGQNPSLVTANPAQTTQNSPSGTIGNATVAGGAPTIPVSKASLIRALVAAGEDINQLKDLTVTALRRKYAANTPTPTPTPPVVPPEAGQTDIATVSPERVASAVEQPTSVLTSADGSPATPPEPVVRPATAGPATPSTVVDTEPPPPAAPIGRVGDVGAAAPSSLIVAPEPPAPKPLSKIEQARADAAAKRALEKAKLTKPADLPILTKTHVADEEASAEHGDAKVIDQEGKVVGTQDEAGTLTRTDTLARNAPAVVETAVATRTMPEVAQAIHAAAGRAARMAGVEAPALVNTWTRDVTRVIQSARSETEAHQLLAEWGAQKGPATPGTKVQRAVVADKLLQLLTGKGLKARAELGREAWVEASRQASVYESEGAASKANIEERSSREQDAARQEALDHGPTEEISQGVVDHSEGVGKVARSEDTTDLTRPLRDLESKIRNEGMTIAEADAVYGKQEGPGRRRRYPDVASWIRERITKEEDPTTRAHLEEALAKHEDPVGKALAIEDARADRGPPEILHNADTDGMVDPRDSRYVTVARDPRLNDHIGKAVEQHESYGASYTLHKALTAIINHTGVNAEMRPLVEIAKRLLKLAPDLPLSTPDHALAKGHITAEDHSHYVPGRTLGFLVSDAYNPDPGNWLNGPGWRAKPRAIVINTDTARRQVETVVHEAMHSVTAPYLFRLEKYDPEHKDLQAMRAITDEMAAALLEQPDGVAAKRLNYATKSVHEMHTMLMTSPEVMAIAASRQASPEFRARMSELGFPPREQGKSVWRYFTDWVRRALGVKAPATVSEYTLLDHLLRPVQDITDRAAKYNERYLPRDPVLRARAEPLYNMLADSFGERAKALRDKLPDGNDTRPYVLAATTTDGIVGRYRDLFDKLQNFTFTNPLVRLRDASEAIARSGKAFSDTYQDRAQTLVAAFNARPDREAIAKLANDATIANVSLGNKDPKANDWIKKPAQQAQLRSLEARFNQLPAASREVYQSLRDFHHEVGVTERNAALTGVLNRVFADATDAQRKAFIKAASSHEGLEKFIADPDNSDLAKAYGQEWATQRALAVGIAKVFDAGRVRGDYFPLKRFGDYVVRYGEANTPEYGVEMFERLGDATARHAELAAAGTDGLAQVDLRATSALREVTRDHPLIDQLDAALRARKDLAAHADDIRDLANRLILQASTRSEAARVRRKGVQGASVDAGRVLAHDFVATGDRIGYLEHGAERFKALNDMRLVAQDLAKPSVGAPGEAIKARQVIHELEQKITAQENPGGRLASLTRKANTFGYVQSLMSWSHILTSSIETHMNATAFLGARHGVIPTTVAMNRALAQLAPTLIAKGARNTFNAAARGLKTADWNLAQFARDKLVAGGANKSHMDRLFASLDRAGLVDHSMVRELRRIANPSGIVGNAAGRVFERFTDLMGAGGHAADVMNKTAVAKVAFDLEMKRSKGDVAQSVTYATDMVRNVTPNYNLGNKPRVTTSAGPLGPFAAPIMQFKLYGLHMYSVVGNLVKASMHGATPEARAEARYAFAGVLASHAMMAGSLTLIGDPLRYIGGAYDLITGADKPHAYENDVRGFLADVFGPEIGALVARGLPGLLGWDLHRRTGLANLLEVPGVDSFDKAGIAKMTATALSGAAGEDIGVFGQGIAKAAHGDFWGAAKDMMPRPVRDVMKAIDLGTKGVTDSKGKTILGADKLSVSDIASQALGVQPSRVSEFREARFAVQERQGEWKAERAKLEQRWLTADPGDRPSIWSDIRQWSSEHHGMGITMGQLLTNQKAARKQASQPAGYFGLRLPVRAARELSDAGRFAQ